jgi:histone H3/H4
MARLKAITPRSSSIKQIKAIKRPSITLISATAKKPHRWRSGTAARLRALRLLKSNRNMVKLAPLYRIVRRAHEGRNWRIRPTSVEVLREFVEATMHEALVHAQMQQVRCGKKTLQVPMVLDGLMHVARRFQNNPFIESISAMPSELHHLTNAVETDSIWSKVYGSIIKHAKNKSK